MNQNFKNMTTIRKSTPAADKKASSLSKARKKVVGSAKTETDSTSVAKINYVFENGMEINGTIEQIEQVAKTMGLKVNYKSIGHRPVGFYPSTSRGMVKISAMNDYHLRRALLKESKEYYGSMYNSEDSNNTFLKKFTGMAENPLVIELFTELSKR